MTRFVAVDLETSGLDPYEHEIIEVGLVIEKPRLGGAMHDSLLIEEFTFSLPFDEARASEKALEINGWGKREFPKLWGPARAIGFLQEALRGVHLVGKNPHFDAEFLRHLFHRWGEKPSWHHRLVDVGSLAWGVDQQSCRSTGFEGTNAPPTTEGVEFILGVHRKPDERHTALGDARWAYRAFRSVVPYGV